MATVLQPDQKQQPAASWPSWPLHTTPPQGNVRQAFKSTSLKPDSLSGTVNHFDYHSVVYSEQSIDSHSRAMPWASAVAARLSQHGATEDGDNEFAAGADSAATGSRVAPERRAGTENERKHQRRKGMTGDSAFRVRLRQAAARFSTRAEAVEICDSEEETQADALVPMFGTEQGDADDTGFGTEHKLQVLQEAGAHVACACHAGDDVHQKLLLLSVPSSTQKSEEQDVSHEVRLAQKCTERLLFQPEQRCSTSLTAEAEILGLDTNTFQRHLETTATAVLGSAANAWSALLSWLKQKASDGELKLKCLIRQRSYDETPLRFRVCEGYDAPAPKSDAKTAKAKHTSVVKVLQTKFRLGMVVQLRDPAKLVFLHGTMPTVLQPLEKTRGVDILKSQMEVLDSIPGIRQLSQAFPSTVNVATADRFSGNLMAEAWRKQLMVVWLGLLESKLNWMIMI